MKKFMFTTAVLLSGCVIAPPPPRVALPAPITVVYQVPPPQQVVSVYVEPPLLQPPPVRVAWAPPPMLVESPPPMPYDGAVWIGGYWVWEGNWVWAHGRWAPPPRSGYAWVHPYYENRGGSVVFVSGFWAAPGVSFVAPSLSINIAFGAVAAGVLAGPRPIGPEGVFVPPPPGSHVGLIVPAPIGTPPAVVMSAPPIVREGMHISINNNSTTVNNNVSSVRNVTNVTNITRVTIIAPANATANGQPVNASVPMQPHLAAAMSPVVKALAPEPVSTTPISTYVPGRPAVVLPPAQTVRSELAPASMQLHAGEHAHAAAAVNPAARDQAATVPGAGMPPARSTPAPGISVHPAAMDQEAIGRPPKPNGAQSGMRIPQDSSPVAVQPVTGTVAVPPRARPAATTASEGPRDPVATDRQTNGRPPQPNLPQLVPQADHGQRDHGPGKPEAAKTASVNPGTAKPAVKPPKQKPGEHVEKNKVQKD